VAFVEVNEHPSDVTGSPSWRVRGRPESTGEFVPSGVLCHHTASPAGTSDAAELNVVMYGNGSAPGPISQLLIGRSATVYLCAAGRSNHAGSAVVPHVGSAATDGNAHLVGIEVGNNGVGEPWSDPVIDAYAAVCRALLDWYGWPLEQMYLHATTGPPAGNYKIDPAGPWREQPDLGGATWDLGIWRDFVASGERPPQPQPGDDLVHTLIRVRDSYVVLAGDMDAQGVVHACRWLGPGLNASIGFQPDNVTPRLPGTHVLERDQADLATITLLGPVPTGDLLAWSPANFYQGG
jgi:hypothetical protein